MPRFFTNFMLFSLLLLLILSTFYTLHMLQKRQSVVKMRIGNTELTVEAARTESQIERGLGYRDKLTYDGMLFYLPSTTPPAFWMKGMRFALDFVWINDGKVIDLTENVPPPASATTPDAQLQIYRPSGPVTHVLEVPAGYVQAHGMKKGDSVELLGH